MAPVVVIIERNKIDGSGSVTFFDLPEENLMRSIKLFGEKVIPALRSYEPFQAGSASC